ncbi:Aste57867_1107 [Aphanomyces stellatus]|uniref:Aste57867_1107 protein n=1 Tax=Aphanomyces stellatus TaxID=120398 RepID=A0A485K4U1_9STRA|nr:hypothetical protein As57867_001106 [Aphanomyces stellatus]VFT78328.1 Aste57867_1107 [Aphanomyces stellatus]
MLSVVQVQRDVHMELVPPLAKRRTCKACDAFSPSCTACMKRRRRLQKKSAERRVSMWESASLNQSWEIPEPVKTRLPQLAKAVASGGPRPPAANVFLQWSGLTLPPPPISSAVNKHTHDKKSAATSQDKHTLTDSQRNAYFGSTGVASTKVIYAKLASQRYLQPDGTAALVGKFKSLLASQSEPSPDSIGVLNSNEAFTARHKFLSLCLDHELPPCLRLIIRNKVSPEINVSHMSMVFCQCLLELPMVMSLNIRNNRLTDPGITAVVNVIRRKPDLCSLDLSENDVDGTGSKSLAAYMSTPTCGLSTLILSHCDIDDDEMLAFAQALCTNKTCHVLDLSRNRIGTNEALNVVQPDLTTGGEALAEMLTVNGHLTVLNLSWNFLRLNSAVQLGKALAQNNSLKELNLSYNAFGNDGAQAIGSALQQNMCLENLDLSNNNIPSKAAFVIAQSLYANDTLTRLTMDGNPLGRIGGSTLLHVVSNSNERNLNISLVGCNFEIEDHNAFDPANATGSYDLDMNLPYERAIALELLRFANVQKGCKFVSFVHSLDKTVRVIPVEKREVTKARAKLIARSAHHSVLRSRLAIDKLEKLFKELDTKNMGSLDAEMLEKGMHLQGLNLRPHEAKQLVARYDIDGTGAIEIAEFVDLMTQYYFDDKPVVEWVDTSSNAPLEIPVDGRLKIEFLDLHIPPDADETVSNGGVKLLIDNIKNDPNQIKLIDLAKGLAGLHLRQDEAQLLLDTTTTGMDMVDALAMILPQVVDANHARPLIELNTNSTQRLRLQAILREMYGPIVGLASGHYTLDLADDRDRAAFKKARSLVMYARRQKNLKDTSQHENHMCFRNEQYNQKSIVITPAFYDALPKYGSLDFDYVQLGRPVPGILPVSDNRFKALMSKLYLDELSAAEPHAARRAVSPSSRQLNVAVYDGLVELQKRHHRVADLNSGDLGSTIKFTPPKENGNPSEPVTYSGRRLLLELQALFCTRWMTTRQARFILDKWPVSFESTRTDAALILFDRILDLYNFTQIFASLTDAEVAQVIYRLGWLNLWSPLIPEMYYELDLTIYEQREVAKVLVQLAMDEPGENWQGATFGWERDACMPGWVLNMSWLAPGNFPQKGYLRVEYYSGADRGCCPVWSTRRASAMNVLAELPQQFDAFLAHHELARRKSCKGSISQPSLPDNADAMIVAAELRALSPPSSMSTSSPLE